MRGSTSRGAVVTPGLVNTHHHLYQTLTRARAQEADLFTWLRELYPVWSRIDAEAEYAAARTGLAELALSGCTTVFDHHYVFPRGREGLIEAEVQAARELGVRIVASRGSMDLGVSDGGLPPDELVEELDAVLAETERLAALLHEPGPGARVQLAVAPCSPFSVTGRLMEESAALARRLGLPLHTHLAETVEEEAYCLELYGCRPVEYLDRLGWLADDVWCAHCVHLSERDIAQFASTGTGVAHCPTSNLRLGAGVAPVRDMLDAGVRVGLGVDGSASNERSDLFLEVKQALLVARGRGGGAAMTARDAIRLGTRGGAAVLRRDDIGSLEPGKCADFAVWRTDGLELGGADDPVAGIVFAGPHRVDRLVVGGEEVVRDGALVRRRRGRDRAGPSRPGAKVLRHERLPLDPRARHRGGPAGRRSGGRAAARRRAGSRAPRPTTTAARASPRRSSRGATASSSTRRRRSSAASSSSSSSRRATTTCRFSSPRSRARATAAAERRGARGALRRQDAVRRAPRRARGPARTRRAVIDELTDAEKREVLDAHPAIGQKSGPVRPLRGRAGHGRRPRGAGRARPAERRVRGAARLPLRRLRQPAAEGRDPRGAARRGSTTRPTRSSRRRSRELVAIASDRWQRG